MGLTLLARTPPWEWPADSANTLLTVLRDLRADETKRPLAAELAGEVVVINDDLAATLLSIAGDASASEALRSRAALSLGPVLEQMEWDSFDDFPGFDEVLADDPPISEHTFHRIRESLRARYLDDDVPQEVRRRILEASVRAPADWHRDAILEAYAHEDRDWRLTAAFAMAYVRGFDDQILATLDDPDVEIRREAVGAAGNWEVDGAWPYVAAMLTAQRIDKALLLAAIEAAASIRPQEAQPLLVSLGDCDDAEIATAAHDALMMAEAAAGDLDEDSEL
jgi:hypothetical protein